MNKNRHSIIGTKEHYAQVMNHITKVMDQIANKAPDAVTELKDIYVGLQIINNEYVLKAYPNFKDDN